MSEDGNCNKYHHNTSHRVYSIILLNDANSATHAIVFRIKAVLRRGAGIRIIGFAPSTRQHPVRINDAGWLHIKASFVSSGENYNYKSVLT